MDLSPQEKRDEAIASFFNSFAKVADKAVEFADLVLRQEEEAQARKVTRRKPGW